MTFNDCFEAMVVNRHLAERMAEAFSLYLGVKALLSKKNDHVFSQENSLNNASVKGWRDGFLIAFLNPKLAIFFLALFSQFLGEDASSEQKMIMTATVGSIDALWYCLVTFTLSRGNIINKLRENSHIVDKVTGSFLILLAARIVIN